MSVLKADGGPVTAEEVRALGRKLGLYLFLPCIVFSAIAVFVGLANWEVEGPAFLIWSVIALTASIWLFRAARRASGRVLLISGAAIVLCCAAFAAFLAWFGFTRSPDAFGGLVYFVIAGGFGLAAARSGINILRAEAAEREEEMERNPFAELGSSPVGEGDRVE
jgi:hypothetical protein